jgi:hypothetical protein
MWEAPCPLVLLISMKFDDAGTAPSKKVFNYNPVAFRAGEIGHRAATEYSASHAFCP